MKTTPTLLSVFAALVGTCSAIGAGSAGGADWRYFAAGGISAATSHGITTPLDVVKTKMQIDPAKYGTNPLSAAKTMVQDDGVMILAQGLAPTIVGYGIEGERKPRIQAQDRGTRATLSTFLLCLSRDPD